jgi:hypothetical protein
MRWMGAIQNALRRAFLDDLARREARSAQPQGESHQLICEGCNTPYDLCDEPECDRASQVSGLCEGCSSAFTNQAHRQSA